MIPRILRAMQDLGVLSLLPNSPRFSLFGAPVKTPHSRGPPSSDQLTKSGLLYDSRRFRLLSKNFSEVNSPLATTERM